MTTTPPAGIAGKPPRRARTTMRLAAAAAVARLAAIPALAATAVAMAATMILAVSALATTTPGHPDYAAEATSYQNATLSAALARVPGGVRISPNTVEWKDYAVMMTVPATPGAPAAPDTRPCYNNYTCIYNAYKFAGTRLEFQDAGYYQDLHYWGGSDWQTHSWRNRIPRLAWLNQYRTSPHGAIACIQGWTLNSHYNGPARADRWILLTKNGSPC